MGVSGCVCVRVVWESVRVSVCLSVCECECECVCVWCFLGVSGSGTLHGHMFSICGDLGAAA